jgi:hypothetical protein
VGAVDLLHPSPARSGRAATKAWSLKGHILRKR